MKNEPSFVWNGIPFYENQRPGVYKPDYAYFGPTFSITVDFDNNCLQYYSNMRFGDWKETGAGRTADEALKSLMSMARGSRPFWLKHVLAIITATS